MVSAALARNVIGIIGNVISLGYFLSPAPMFYGMIKKKVVDKEVDNFLYIFATMNCAFWVLYGMPFVRPQSLLVVTNYSVGLLIHLIYLTIICIYTNTDTRVNGIGAFIGLIELMLYAWHVDLKAKAE